MKIITALLIFLHINLIADDISFEVKGILHNESEYMIDKDNNSFSSFYSHLLSNYNFTQDIFLSLGLKSNIVVYENNYKTPLYSQTKLKSDEINRAIISDFSLNYDNGFFALNLGRQDLNYDWLLGSIDGVLAMVGNDEEYSLRLFWFEDYQHLQYNYYIKIENINAHKGMYGAIAKANLGEIEFSYFDYFVQDLRNIMGTHVNYVYKNIGLNISYTSAKALSLALYDYDEEFLNGSFEFLINQNFFELGFSQTGENGLLAMIQMGNFMFGQFYLSNQVDRENAQNGFLKYIYGDGKWRFEFIGGVTKYDNSFLEIQNDMNSYELDSYLKYNYSKNLSFDLGAIYMNVDERDALQVDQALVMFNVVVNYENY